MFICYTTRDKGVLALTAKGTMPHSTMSALADSNLAKNRVLSMLCMSFDKSCLPYEIMPPAWNVAQFVCRSLI